MVNMTNFGMVHYNLGLIYVVLYIISFGYYNIVLITVRSGNKTTLLQQSLRSLKARAVLPDNLNHLNWRKDQK